MPAKVLFAGRPAIWPVYRETLAAAFDRKGIRAELFDRCDDPATVDYIVYSPNQALTDFRPFTRLKAVLSLWAGVETIQTNQTLTAPLARMVDAGLTDGMAEWVLGHVMRYHLGIDRHLFGQDGIWRGADPVPPLARDRAVGILGLGTLGLASARLLPDEVMWNRCQQVAAILTISRPVTVSTAQRKATSSHPQPTNRSSKPPVSACIAVSSASNCFAGSAQRELSMISVSMRL